MVKGKKRKHLDDTNGPDSKRKPDHCILHVPGSDPGAFTAFTNIKAEPCDKLAFLHGIRDKRLGQPPESKHRMEAVWKQIPESLEEADLETVGYHKQCYQLFTCNLHGLRLPGDDPQPSTSRRHHSPRKHQDSDSKKSLLFPPECIFCDKVQIKVSGRTERPIKFTLEHAWHKIASSAVELGKTSLHRKVKYIDLCAAEAMFHPHCRKTFGTEYSNHLRTVEREQNRKNTVQVQKSQAHNQAYHAVCTFINDHVIEQGEVVQLSSLRLIYIGELDAYGFPNKDFRSQKLMIRLQTDPDISSKIAFTKVNPSDTGFVSFYLMYSTSITVADAVALSYKLASMDKTQDVALLLRSLIRHAFNDTKPLPWPPTAEDMNIKSNDLPEELIKFLNVILGGKPQVSCAKTNRIILSIGQDICRSVTDGEWKLPKHILLCTTIRHLYSSKQLTSILNRLGHCESYDFGRELETAQAKALEEVSSLLTPQIVTGEGNLIFHSEWDNLNKIMTNVNGSNVVNSAGGIMIQESKPDCDVTQCMRTLPVYARSKERSLNMEHSQSLPVVHIYNINGPKFPLDASFTPPLENTERWSTAMLEYHVWILTRTIGSHGHQQVPAFGGFISATGTAPMKKSNIDYYTPTNEPITENNTVVELLRRSEEATAEVGQKYVISTYDLGVCMKALPPV